ncbi:MAG: hypothetical protein K2Q20_12385 [Phycisphaerales bacterium]|nr:hypothetical protein [Phycisphaerales bacterium]
MLELNTIPMEQFALRWRLTDPKYRVVPAIHLEQIKPLDAASAQRLFEMTESWYVRQMQETGLFADVVWTDFYSRDAAEIRRVRKWLYQRGIPFQHRVFLLWSPTEAVVTTWKIFIKYWDDLWYPSSDDLTVFDSSLSWLLSVWHDGSATFESRPIKTPPSASDR